MLDEKMQLLLVWMGKKARVGMCSDGEEKQLLLMRMSKVHSHLRPLVQTRCCCDKNMFVASTVLWFDRLSRAFSGKGGTGIPPKGTLVSRKGGYPFRGTPFPPFLEADTDEAEKRKKNKVF